MPSTYTSSQYLPNSKLKPNHDFFVIIFKNRNDQITIATYQKLALHIQVELEQALDCLWAV